MARSSMSTDEIVAAGSRRSDRVFKAQGWPRTVTLTQLELATTISLAIYDVVTTIDDRATKQRNDDFRGATPGEEPTKCEHG
jgi:hypothetical protein